MILAVMLSSFLLFSVFTVGITYFKMQRQQNIRLSGAEFDAIMYGVTKKQMETLINNSDVEAVGIAAVSGAVEETVYDRPGLLESDDGSGERVGYR